MRRHRRREPRNAVELVERAARQRRRDRRHEQCVGGAEHALAGQRDPRRAVEQGDVVARRQRVEQRRRAGRASASSRCRSRWRSEKSAGSTSIPATSLARTWSPSSVRPATSLRAPPLMRRLDAHEERRRALRVEVPQQHPGAGAGRLVGEVDRRRRLPDAALDAVGGEDLHPAGPVEHRSQRSAGRLAVVLGEALGELLARRRLRRRSSCSTSWPMATNVSAGVVGGSSAATVPQHVGVDLGVLVLAEVVLQRLEPLDERLALAPPGAGCRSTRAGSAAAWRPCAPRGRPRPGSSGVIARPWSTQAVPRPSRCAARRRRRAVARRADRVRRTRSASHVRQRSSSSTTRAEREVRGELAVGGGAVRRRAGRAPAASAAAGVAGQGRPRSRPTPRHSTSRSRGGPVSWPRC